MSTKVIRQEFVVSDGTDSLEPVTLGYAWSSYMNTYAAWPYGGGNTVTIRRNINLQAGNYYVTGTVDNTGSVSINGRQISLYNFGDNVSRTAIGNNTKIYHSGGEMSIVISATNTGGPRGVAVTISAEARDLTTVSNQPPNLGAVYTVYGTPYVGDLVWSTRSTGIASSGRYQITIPFKAQITAHLWGAGGGGGGMDAGSYGGYGAHGLYNTHTFIVNKGDVIDVVVGERGMGGSSNSGSAPGGIAGKSGVNFQGSSSKSFNGGNGSAAGPSPYSGGGGGGGGATAILVNESPVLVAAGGAGGGGGGNDGNGSAQEVRRNATIQNKASAIVGSTSEYRGQSGQTKGGDGGGAGGGGGGYPGGLGGAVAGGDASGHAGQCGGNYPVYAASTGENSSYYKTGYAKGGNRGGGNGESGLAILIIEPVGLVSTKISGEWKQISDGYVKVSGNWKPLDSIFVKINGEWKTIGGSGIRSIEFEKSTENYGSVNRPY
jgi:hypothetical protein